MAQRNGYQNGNGGYDGNRGGGGGGGNFRGGGGGNFRGGGGGNFRGRGGNNSNGYQNGMGGGGGRFNHSHNHFLTQSQIHAVANLFKLKTNSPGDVYLYTTTFERRTTGSTTAGSARISQNGSVDNNSDGVLNGIVNSPVLNGIAAATAAATDSQELILDDAKIVDLDNNVEVVSCLSAGTPASSGSLPSNSSANIITKRHSFESTSSAPLPDDTQPALKTQLLMRRKIKAKIEENFNGNVLSIHDGHVYIIGQAAAPPMFQRITIEDPPCELVLTRRPKALDEGAREFKCLFEIQIKRFLNHELKLVQIGKSHFHIPPNIADSKVIEVSSMYTLNYAEGFEIGLLKAHGAAECSLQVRPKCRIFSRKPCNELIISLKQFYRQRGMNQEEAERKIQERLHGCKFITNYRTNSVNRIEKICFNSNVDVRQVKMNREEDKITIRGYYQRFYPKVQLDDACQPLLIVAREKGKKRDGTTIIEEYPYPSECCVLIGFPPEELVDRTKCLPVISKVTRKGPAERIATAKSLVDQFNAQAVNGKISIGMSSSRGGEQQQNQALSFELTAEPQSVVGNNLRAMHPELFKPAINPDSFKRGILGDDFSALPPTTAKEAKINLRNILPCLVPKPIRPDSKRNSDFLLETELMTPNLAEIRPSDGSNKAPGTTNMFFQNEWFLVYCETDEDLAQILFKEFERCGSAAKIPVEFPRRIVCSRKWEEWSANVKRAMDQFGTPQMIVYILPDCSCPPLACDRLYESLKSLLTRDDSTHVALSQCIRAKNIKNGKNVSSICQTAFLQTLAKRGCTLWTFRNLKGRESRQLIVGINAVPVGDKKNRIVVMTATTNPHFSSYYFRAEKVAGLYANTLQNFIYTSCKEYFRNCDKKLPAEVIVYRCGLSQTQLVGAELEVDALKLGLSQVEKETGTPAAKLCYIAIDKDCNLRFAHNSENVPPLTVFQDEVVENKETQFCCIHQYVQPNASCTPTYYQIITNQTDTTVDQLKVLSSQLSCLYFNWPGPITVPAPVKYAEKLAHYCAATIQNMFHANLRRKLFFI